jgi:hypothetical protein
MSKLTEDEVIELRERYANGTPTQKELADEYGITRPEVGHIVQGRKWTETGGPIAGDQTGRNGYDTGAGGGNKKLDESDVVEIRERYAETSESTYAIADDYPIGPGSIQNIVAGRTWEDVGGPTT